MTLDPVDASDSLVQQEESSLGTSPVEFISNASSESMLVEADAADLVNDTLMALDDSPPALPAVDYQRKLGAHSLEFPPLGDGLEADGQHEFVWHIPKWSALNEDRNFSPDFEFAGYNWKVMLMPKGNDEPRAKACAIFVAASPVSSSDDWHVCARLVIALRNPADPKVVLSKITHHRFNSGESDWGFNTFAPLRIIKTGDASTLNKPLLDKDAVDVVIRIQIIKDPIGNLWHSFVNYDSKKATGCVGLQNQGATCYMNSLLQSLFMTNALRKATYQIPTEDDKPTESIALALQRTFYRLQTSAAPVGTTELTKSFGWDSIDSFMQHDVHEFNRVLMDELENKMKGTEVEGMVQKIFTGKVKNVRKCLKVDFESAREEDFYDIQLTVRGVKTLQESFEAYIKPEYLTGDNKYQTEEFGYQDAKMFCIFERFPPVLHLHLERYTFDPYTGNTIKINDRLEFPSHINLDKYLSETADRSVPQDYTLHSVLVHGGDSSGGHYFVFIKKGDKWCKFDDTRVIEVSEREAIEDNYGVDEAEVPPSFIDGEISYMRPPPSYTTRAQRFKKITNAYMLVYIRDADFAQMMSPVTDEDIPEYLAAGVKADEEAEIRRRNERHETMMALHLSLFSDERLRAYSGVDFFNLFNRAQPLTDYDSFRVRKDHTIADLKEILSEDLNLPMEAMRLWNFAARRNNTYRLDQPVGDDRQLGQLCSGSRVTSQLNLFLEVAPKDTEGAYLPLPEYNQGTSMVCFKYFDRTNYTLSVIGNFVVNNSDTIETTLKDITPRLGLMEEGEWEAFEEVKPTRVEQLPLQVNLVQAKVGTGDIIVIQQAVQDVPSAVQYYHDVVNRILVCFKPLEEASRKRSSEDLPKTPSFGHFSLFSSWEAPFQEVLEFVAKQVGHQPDRIRLHLSDPRSDRFHVMRSMERPDMTFAQAIAVCAQVPLPHKETISELTFAIEILTMSLADLESMKPLRLVVADEKGQADPSDAFEVYVPFEGTLADLLNGLPPHIVPQGRKYRLLEIVGHRITHDFDLDDLLSPLANQALVWLVPVPEDEQEGDKLIRVFSYWREPLRAHSAPFLFNLRAGEQFAVTKKRLLARSGHSDAAVQFVAFGTPRPIEDNDVLYDHVKCLPASNRVTPSDSLGIDVLEPGHQATPKMGGERSIKIKSQPK